MASGLLQTADAVIVSSTNKAQAKKIYSWYFSEDAILPDISVKVSPDAILPDITMKIVHDPKQADLIVTDNFAKADIFINKAKSSIGKKVVKVSPDVILPDVTVKLSEDALFPDYKIYVLSSIYTKEEAAAIFVVLWKAKQK